MSTKKITEKQLSDTLLNLIKSTKKYFGIL